MHGGKWWSWLNGSGFVLWVCAWLVCFAFALDAAANGLGRPPLVVSRTSANQAPPRNAGALPIDNYPLVVGHNSPSSSWQESVHAGDRLIAVGSTDLRGMGPLELYIPFAQYRGWNHVVRVTLARGPVTSSVSLPVPTYSPYWPRVVASLIFAACALVLRRRSRNPAISAIVAAFMATATFLACTFSGSEPIATLSIAAHIGSVALLAPLTLRAALMFPNGVTPGWPGERIWPWFFVLLGPLGGSRFYELWLPRAIGSVANTIGELLLLVALVAIGITNYRRADETGRRQLKWVSLALYIAVIGPLACVVLAGFDVRFLSSLIISMAGLALIPLAMVIAIWRDNLFDIDRLIGATAVNSTILGALFAIAAFAAPGLEVLASEKLQLGPEGARIVLALAACAVLVPLYVVIKPRIEAILPSEQQRLMSGIMEVISALPAARSADDLLCAAGDLLYRHVSLESCTVYLRTNEGFWPVLCRGVTASSVLPTTSPLIDAIGEGKIVRSRELAESRAADGWPELEHAVLAALGMPLLLPVRRGSELTGLLCVGPRRSGIEYEAGDLRAAGLLQQRLSVELARCDERLLTTRAEDLARHYQAYVPAAVARELESGRSLRQGVCEVSVLFVDVRNYSGYCEPRSGEAIFAAVSAHTLRVSAILVRHGGSVVDFSGDGMMAIFGAPRELANKESCAVAAALEVATLSFGQSERGEAFAVGIGIATGDAYVGHIQALDRRIWSAVGNTTNLAARLQAKTRSLDAAIVIDATTHERARPEPQLFQRLAAQEIRGRKKLEDMYAVPLRSLSEHRHAAPQAAQTRVRAEGEGTAT